MSRGTNTDIAKRLARAKLAYTTRRVDDEALVELITEGVTPRAGDLVLARVETIGQHKRIEQRDGRRATLFTEDEIVVSYGDRYAPDQFESEVPADLSPCDLIAAGGVAGRMLLRHAAMDEPTRIVPIGLLGDGSGRPVNLADFALGPAPPPTRRPLTIAVVGTSMNAGKTTIAANLARGFVLAGSRVGAAKVTGTGAGGDRWLVEDAGASPVLDFTDAGFVSTYGLDEEMIDRILENLTDHLAASGSEVIVLEVADGIFQAETAALLRSRLFASRVDGLLFAGGDAVGAAAGAEELRARGLPIWALSGTFSASPLAMREAAEATGLPVLDQQTLRDPARIQAVRASAEALAT
jgi:hypothetical protein